MPEASAASATAEVSQDDSAVDEGQTVVIFPDDSEK